MSEDDKTQKEIWEAMSEMEKRIFLVGHSVALTGKKIEPDHERIDFTVEFIDTTYRENPGAENIKPIDIIKQSRRC